MTPKPQLVTPGEMLAAARKEAGFSLIELEARTKVPRQTLAAIEQDEYHKVSGELYVKSFLRSYAGEVGLDPAEVLQLYNQFSGTSGAGPSVTGEADVWTEEVRITRIGVPWGRVGGGHRGGGRRGGPGGRPLARRTARGFDSGERRCACRNNRAGCNGAIRRRRDRGPPTTASRARRPGPSSHRSNRQRGRQPRRRAGRPCLRCRAMRPSPLPTARTGR